MTIPVTQILEKQDDRVRLALTVPPDHRAFAGHFPDHPILPGVVQLEWAVQLARQYFELGPVFAQDIQIKFQKIIPPALPFELTLSVDRSKRRLSFVYATPDQPLSSGRLCWGG